jgi:hypothetical protein
LLGVIDDVRKMQFADGSIDVVLDKGTMDALLVRILCLPRLVFESTKVDMRVVV